MDLTSMFFRGIVKKLAAGIAAERAHELLSSVKENICTFQKRCPDYQYMIDSAHHTLEMYLKDNEREALDPEILKKYITIISQECTANLQHAVRIAEEGVLEYYKIEERFGDVLPRVCIKGHQDGNVFDISPKPDFKEDTFKIEDNSLLQAVTVKAEMKYENDLPDAVKSGRYKSKRIDSVRAEAYMPPNLTKKIKKTLSKDPQVDEKWIALWDLDEKGNKKYMYGDVKSYYKSTLVVPITLARADLSAHFQKNFLDNDVAPAKAIFGFLCVDHVYPNYFNHDKDQQIGWIYSDLLSFPIITYLTYIIKSDVYKKSRDILQEIEPEMLSDIDQKIPLLEPPRQV